MTVSRLLSSTDRVKLAVLALAVTAFAGCGSSGSDAAASSAGSVTTQSEAEEAATTTAPEVGEETADTADTGGVDDCDDDTRQYTPFTEIPDTWPSDFPRPEGLEEISGDVGTGCDRVSVDMRSRYYGVSREWVATYGDQLSDAGFVLDDEYDELNQLTLTYRSGKDWISYGGPIELEGSDREYIAVGVVMVDFPD